MRVEDIVNKVFARSFMGYDIEQVDLFLDEIIERFEQYESEKKEMLLAMEYLLNKLENNRKLPIDEMRKAIDPEKTQKKRLPSSARPKEAEAAPARPEKAAPTREETKPARSIARGAQPPKPMRAPKVSRVRMEQEQPEQEPKKGPTASQVRAAEAPDDRSGAGTEAAANDAPAMENWLDELLINLIEREKTGSGEPPQSPETPDQHNGGNDFRRTKPEAAGPEEEAAEDEPPAVEEEPR